MDLPGTQAFAPGAEFKNCRLQLPDQAPIPVALVVRNLFRITNRQGREMLRIGCQFTGLSAANANLIQRFILRTEQERAGR